MKQTTAIGFMAELYLWNYAHNVAPTRHMPRRLALDMYRTACLVRTFGPVSA